MRAETLALPRGLRVRDVAELSKSGITAMVVVSAAVGILLAGGAAAGWALWLNALLGTALVSAGGGALNQVLEREHDARMRRTAHRPLPAGRIHPDAALAFGVAVSIAGLALLAAGTNLLAALLAGGTLAGYVFVYTPLKRVSSLATVVGAVPGAVPPMIGWAAVRGELGAGAWALFALLFFWQMPHFLAIAWLYRADYERGGFPFLSVRDAQGLRTGRQGLLYAAALVPVSLLPAALGLAGPLYFLGALCCGLAFFGFAAIFALDRSITHARRLMLASVFYLPVVLGILVVDRMVS